MSLVYDKVICQELSNIAAVLQRKSHRTSNAWGSLSPNETYTKKDIF